MYELIVLSLLMRGPFHGYLIVKIANDMIGPWAKISSGTLYPLLGKMEQTGLIAAAPWSQSGSGERQARTFVITDEGRKRFHKLMMDMSSNLGEYEKIFRYKMAFIDLLKSKERLLLFNHYMNYCSTSILHMQTERANLAHELSQQPDTVFLENVVRTIQHVEDQLQRELDWARELRADELARAEALPTNAAPTNTEGTPHNQQ